MSTAAGTIARTNTPTRSAEMLLKIYAGRLFDPYTAQLLPRRAITVCPASGLVVDVREYEPDEPIAPDDATLDLRGLTVLPGFVDAHVHFFLHPYSETPWQDQVTKETIVERTVRATVHARRTLMAGYTTVRDLGTEGAGDADLALRKCLSGTHPLIPGPRYFAANRAIVATGSYGPRSVLHVSREGVEGVTGAEVADGPVECVKAVRRQIGAGADWIKIYADYRPRVRMADVSPQVAAASIQTFNDAEIGAMTAAAHQLGVKVAAHAQSWRAGLLLEHGGAHTLEHGNDLGADALLPEILATATIWVPTLSVFYTQDRDGLWDRTARNFQRALASGVTRIACGGDTGPFPHGDNALEMKLMARLGAGWRQILRWCTLGGWEAVRSTGWEGECGEARLAAVEELREDQRKVGDNEVPFGAVRKGFAADIIATRGDLEADFEGAVDKANIVFVMKAGKVYKLEGSELV